MLPLKISLHNSTSIENCNSFTDCTNNVRMIKKNNENHKFERLVSCKIKKTHFLQLLAVSFT